MRLWPDYYYDNRMALRPNENAAKINFNDIKRLLLSTDIEKSSKEYENLVSANIPKFLDKKVDLTGNRILLGSFPRSGNSFLRKILE